VTGERQGCKTGEGRRKCGRRRAAAKGSGERAGLRECKRQRLLLLLRRPCPSPSQKATLFKLLSFFLCSLRIGLLDVNGSE